MKFFVDTANLDEISEAQSWGALAGVTTNPSLYAKIGGKVQDFPKHIAKICQIVDGPVSAETMAETPEGMVEDGCNLAKIADNVCVKIPMTPAGLSATHELSKKGIPVNMTLVFSVSQAIMAARAGARYISPFIGRFDDIGEDGLEQVENIVAAIKNYDFTGVGIKGEEVEVIAASVRSVNHVTQVALMGADIATVPFAVLKKCIMHPLTNEGIEKFKADWQKVVLA